MIGLVGKYDNYIRWLEGELTVAFIEKFLKRNCIKRTLKKGIASYEGNQARKYLKRVAKMDQMLESNTTLSQETKEKILLCTKAMYTLNLVVHACFGMTLKHSNGHYKDLINLYSKQVRDIPDMSIIVKGHCLETHVSEFLDLKGDGVKGLGYWSEQATESSHHAFKVEDSRSRLPPDHPNYKENLYRTVLRINGKNV